MKIVRIQEGAIQVEVPDPKEYKLDSSMPVFYNPIMQLNRDISILLLRALNRNLSVLDLLAASGVRGLRIAKEIPRSTVTLNDANPSAVTLIQKNAQQNKLKIETLHFSANKLLADTKRKWDYIDVDPFGTPIPFLENAISRLSNKGIIGVTATDTSALCGTYPNACLRKYHSRSLRCPQMHEIGIRILINATQEVGEKQSIYLKPIFSHSTNHYMRIYLKRVAKKQASKGFFHYCFSCGSMKTAKRYAPKVCSCGAKMDWAGPLWIGKLWDRRLIRKMIDLADSDDSTETIKFLKVIYEESKINTIGFYQIHALAKMHSWSNVPKFQNVIEKLRKKSYKAERTHFDLLGIRTNATLCAMRSESHTR